MNAEPLSSNGLDIERLFDDLASQLEPAPSAADALRRLRQAFAQRITQAQQQIETLQADRRLLEASLADLQHRCSSAPVPGLLANVSERKQPEELLPTSEQRIRLLVENASDILFRHELVPGFKPSYLSPAVQKITGYTPEEYYQNPVLALDVVHPADRHLIMPFLRGTVSGEKVLTLRFLHKDGHVVWTEQTAIPIFDDKGLLVAVEGIARDVTQRHQMEQDLRKSRDRIALTIEAGHAGFAYWDLRTNEFSWNARYFEILGYEPGSIKPSYEAWRQRIHPADLPRAEATIRSCFEQQGNYIEEYRLLRPDGELRWARFAGHVEYDADGRPLNATAIVFDVTDLRRAAEKAEADSQAKDQFLAILSHELRTPLAPVLTAAQMMQDTPLLPPELHDSFAMIRRNVQLEARLIDDLLDLNRIIHGKLELHREPVDLHEKLQHVIEMCDSDIRDRQLELVVKPNASCFWIEGDPARIQQIIWNLLKNAVKFTSAGGEITVCTLNPTPDRLCLTVRDTGIGIDPEILPRLFSPFEQGGAAITNRYGGLGVGLALSRAFAEAQHGTLIASSEGRGKGATLTLELPAIVCPTPLPAAPRQARPEKAPLAGGRLLLVEDHADTARTMSTLLQHFGYRVQIADSIASALRAAEAAEPFDLLLCDIGLPDGSGLDLIRQIQARYPIKGIALSGFGMEEDIRRSIEAGFRAHLVKPIDFDRLEAALREIC